MMIHEFSSVHNNTETPIKPNAFPSYNVLWEKVQSKSCKSKKSVFYIQVRRVQLLDKTFMSWHMVIYILYRTWTKRCDRLLDTYLLYSTDDCKIKNIFSFTVLLHMKKFQRTGIEPVSNAWEASILPLNYR